MTQSRSEFLEIGGIALHVFHVIKSKFCRANSHYDFNLSHHHNDRYFKINTKEQYGPEICIKKDSVTAHCRSGDIKASLEIPLYDPNLDQKLIDFMTIMLLPPAVHITLGINKALPKELKEFVSIRGPRYDQITEDMLLSIEELIDE